MHQIRHSPICLPGVAAVPFCPDGEAALFYHVCPPSDETTLLGRPCLPSTTPGAFSHCMEVVRPLSLHIRIHVGQTKCRFSFSSFGTYYRYFTTFALVQATTRRHLSWDQYQSQGRRSPSNLSRSRPSILSWSNPRWPCLASSMATSDEAVPTTPDDLNDHPIPVSPATPPAAS